MIFSFCTYSIDINRKSVNTTYTHAKHKYVCSLHTVLRAWDKKNKLEHARKMRVCLLVLGKTPEYLELPRKRKTGRKD